MDFSGTPVRPMRVRTGTPGHPNFVAFCIMFKFINLFPKIKGTLPVHIHARLPVISK